METSKELIPVRFSGNAREYFGIWIVNLCLSIVTLGIYSAWAKVRNKRYFLGNTTIGERAFEYHAKGIQILIGRIIVVAALIILSVSSSISPTANIIVAIVFVGAFPWLVNRGLSFNAAMTSWSNVRFRFGGNYWPAFLVFVLYPFLTILSLYLAFPYLSRAISRYTIGRHSLGNHKFSFDSPIRPFFIAFLKTALWAVIGLALAVGLLLMALRPYDPSVLISDSGDVLSFILVLVSAIIVLLVVLPLGTIYSAFTRNAIYQGIVLENGHRFKSTISATTLIWIALSNSVAVVFSLGLLLPWARIRVARYLCAHSWVAPNTSLDEFAGDLQRSPTAIGDAYMDIESVDIGAAV